MGREAPEGASDNELFIRFLLSAKLPCNRVVKNLRERRSRAGGSRSGSGAGGIFSLLPEQCSRSLSMTTAASSVPPEPQELTFKDPNSHFDVDGCCVVLVEGKACGKKVDGKRPSDRARHLVKTHSMEGTLWRAFYIGTI